MSKEIISDTEITVAELKAALTQRSGELAVINSVQEGLSRNMDIQAIYELVGNKIQDVFNAQVVMIGTLDQETGLENQKYNIEKGERYYPAPRPIDKLRQHLIDTGEKIVINTNVEEAIPKFGLKAVSYTHLTLPTTPYV